jgi:predicted transglutaminase-like cysteine proteinase
MKIKKITTRSDIGLFRLKNILSLASPSTCAKTALSIKYVRMLVLSISFLTPIMANASNGIKVEAIFDPMAQYDYKIPISANRGLVDDHVKLIGEIKGIKEYQKVEIINRFFNDHVAYVGDGYSGSNLDYWQSSTETLNRGAGDCEDYAIAKYFSLVQLGVDAKKLKITYVRGASINQAHMVLTYSSTPGASALVMDNMVNEIINLSETDYTVVYAFNADSLYLPGREAPISNVESLSKWQSVLARHSTYAKAGDYVAALDF